MESSSLERTLVRAGFSLIFLALVTGFAIPQFVNPRMALAAHMSGVLNGLLLVAFGCVWNQLALSPGQGRLARGAAIFAAYMNWATSCLAAAWGTSRLTPLSSAGHAADPWKETLVQAGQVSLALAILLALGLVLYGLRGSPVKK
jgi:(hydroxyamino)benzene mutase